jgi:hypothetical protein
MPTTTASRNFLILHHPYADGLMAGRDRAIDGFYGFDGLTAGALGQGNKLLYASSRKTGEAWETWMNTTDRVRLTINLEQVAKNLRTPDGSSVGENTARSYLHHVGFTPDAGGTWTGPRSGLGRLNHSEVVRIEPLWQ